MFLVGHDWGEQTWSTPANAFICNNNLSQLTTHNIIPCTAAQDAANTWNVVSNSNWSLVYHNGTSSPIHIETGQASNDSWAAETINVSQNNRVIGSTMSIDPDYCFGDSSNSDSPGTCYDMESITLHEFGHIQSLHHEWWNSVMVDNINPGIQKRTLYQHDIDVLQSRY